VQASVVLPFDAEAADHAARIRLGLESGGTPIGGPDLLIAATARRHGCILVTHDTREFSRVPELVIEDWY
jgi:tRNA(fMet)-specific endonuclease VapC